MSKQMTFSPALAEALVAMLGPMLQQSKGRKSRSDKGFTKGLVQEAQTTDERKAALDAATVLAFSKAGFGTSPITRLEKRAWTSVPLTSKSRCSNPSNHGMAFPLGGLKCPPAPNYKARPVAPP